MNIEFKDSYHSNVRNDILNIIPSKVKRVLDVGCGSGLLGKSLKDKGVQTVIGIELNKKAAGIASNRLDEVLIGDIEKVSLLQFGDAFFDCIIYADILEHLVDPWSVLSKHREFLSDDGFIIISIPNIRHIHTFWNLLRGNWTYVDRGIFDRTHLRFFTLRSIIESLNNAGYDVITINRDYRIFERSGRFGNIAKFLSLWFFRDFLTFQYLIVGRRK